MPVGYLTSTPQGQDYDDRPPMRSPAYGRQLIARGSFWQKHSDDRDKPEYDGVAGRLWVWLRGCGPGVTRSEGGAIGFSPGALAAEVPSELPYQWLDRAARLTAFRAVQP
jgi:hypothetical protein